MEVVASLSQGRTAAAQCGLFTHTSVPVIFEPPCILGRSLHTIKKNTEALVAVGVEIGLEVNCEKTNCVVKSRDQNAGQSHSTKTDNIPFQRGGRVQIFWNKPKAPNFNSGRN